MRCPLPLLFLALLAPLGFGQESRRPNIVVVLSDDHAQAAMGAYGGPLARVDPTPNLDRLASQGMLFENAFCTNSICGPSRAVFLTGKHSHVNGFQKNGNRFDGSQPTFASLLQGAGYQTALMGKWHLGTEPQGFDHWQVLPGQGDYYNPKFKTPEGTVQVEGYCSDVVTDLAIRWLEEERDPDQPFLLLAWHKAPHRNWMPGPDEYDLYVDTLFPMPGSVHDEFRDNASPARFHQMGVRDHLHPFYDLFAPQPPDASGVVATDRSGHRNLAGLTPAQRAAWDAHLEPHAGELDDLQGPALVEAKLQRYLRQYLRSVRGMDRNVGRLVDHLDAMGLGQDTLVVYASDQGFYLGEHGWYDKRWMYEESLRLPFVVRWPGQVEPGSRSQHMVQNLDLAPTLLQAAGLDLPADLQGRALQPVFADPAGAPWRDAIYYHYYGYPAVHNVARHRGIRTQRHKLIQYYGFGEWELFDLALDPTEQRNLFGQPGTETLVADLSLRLGQLAAHYGDEGPFERIPPAEMARHRPLPVDFPLPDLARVANLVLDPALPRPGQPGPNQPVPRSTDLPAHLGEHYVVSQAVWQENSHVGGMDLTGRLLLHGGQELPFGLRPGGLAWIDVPESGRLHLMAEYRPPLPGQPIPVRLAAYASGPIHFPGTR